MKNIITQEEKDAIDQLCKKYDITKYTINGDGSIDVDGDAILDWSSLRSIPLRFNKVTGDFNCTGNKISTLENCPKEVGGNFKCSHNRLTSLEHCVDKVGGNFVCNNNIITSLEHCPDKVGGNFECVSNSLTDLLGCPNVINGNFYCTNNRLTSLLGTPEEVNGVFICYENDDLTSLEYCPTVVGLEFHCYDTKLPKEIINLFDDLVSTFSIPEQLIFLKYQSYYNVWTPEFNVQGMNDLVDEIKDGLR